MDGLVLAVGSCSIAERHQVVGAEWVPTILVCVQYRNQCWPLLNDANASVAVAVDASFVTFGQAEPTLQVEVVVRQVRLVATHKQAGQKAAHQLGHLLAAGISRAGMELLLQGFEACLALGGRAVVRIESGVHQSHISNLQANGVLGVFNGVQTTVDAVGQALQLLVSAPPFLASRLRCKEA